VIAERSKAALGLLPDAANSAGGWLAGVLPHRGPAGSGVNEAGLNAADMLTSPLKAYLLVNVEPANDCYDAAAASQAVEAAEFVVSISPFASADTMAAADVLLPAAPFTETSGTFVSAEGRWQSFAGVATPVGESRPGWKILRVLGNQFGLDGFDQSSSDAIRDALRAQCGTLSLDNKQAAGPVVGMAEIEGLQRIGDVAILATDPLVRRASALQQSPDAEVAGLLRINPAQAEAAGLRDGYRVRVRQGAAQVEMDVSIDARVADNCLWIQSGTRASAALGPAYGAVTVERV
jgi:NADH-quinone oxidoreductase subunit G